MVGFGLRDRDFDHILLNIEIEFGNWLENAFFVDLKPAYSAGASPAEIKKADLKKSRHETLRVQSGLHRLDLSSFAELPRKLSQLKEAGSLIGALVNDAIDRDRVKRRLAHARIRSLSRVGAHQVFEEVMRIVPILSDRDQISEALYLLGQIDVNHVEIEDLLIDAIEAAMHRWHVSENIGDTEVIAHGLVALRVRRSNRRDYLKQSIQSFGTRLIDIDFWLQARALSPRLSDYCKAAAWEMYERSEIT